MPKRKRLVLSMKVKCEIIKRLEEGETPANLCNEYKIGRSTITDLKRRKTNITSYLSPLYSTNGAASRKTMKLPNITDVDDAVYKWFTQKRSLGHLITGAILCEKAIEFNKGLGGPENFRASTGWVKRFKVRHGIHDLKILSADCFKSMVEEILSDEDYALENVYNADEKGLYWKALPRKILPSSFETSDAKMNKERITVLACANATGTHRLPMFVIGTNKKPRCFKHVSTSAMPIIYTYQKNGCIDNSIFVEWFSNVFIPSVTVHQTNSGNRKKTLLIIDFAPIHPSYEILNEKDEFIKVMFIAPNLTSILQPMDQGVIEIFKLNYRKEFLRKLLLEIEDEGRESLLRNYEKFDFKEASYMFAAAWNGIKEEDLKKAWNKILDLEDFQKPNTIDNQADVNEILDMLKEFNYHECDEADVKEWLSVDSADLGYTIMEDSEIISSIIDKTDACPTSSNDVETDYGEVPTVSEGLESLDTALRWLESQEETNVRQITALREVRDLAARKRARLIRQAKVENLLQL